MYRRRRIVVAGRRGASEWQQYRSGLLVFGDAEERVQVVSGRPTPRAQVPDGQATLPSVGIS